MCCQEDCHAAEKGIGGRERAESFQRKRQTLARFDRSLAKRLQDTYVPVGNGAPAKVFFNMRYGASGSVV